MKLLLYIFFKAICSNLAGNSTIYSSVTQKLRKERGQNLDAFICTFMQSIEQSTDFGEDVIEMKEIESNEKNPQPPGQSFIFGDLFGVKSSIKQPSREALAEQMHRIHGSSECFIYICELKNIVTTLPTSHFITMFLFLIFISLFSFSGAYFGCEPIHCPVDFGLCKHIEIDC